MPAVMSPTLPRPGYALGYYPQRIEPETGRLDEAAAVLTGAVLGRLRRRSVQFRRFVQAVISEGQPLRGLSDRALDEQIQLLRQRLSCRGFAVPLVVRSFALVREVASRKLGMSHYEVQLMGGLALLQGQVAEMETGEGKTFTATLPACTAALAGVPVHIITVNDYLASRDAALLAPLYQAFGLTVGVSQADQDPAARRAAYACDVTYCTNKQVAFDYLRDSLVLRDRPGQLHLLCERLYQEQPRNAQLLLRGLCFAIVDEADSVLIDEARTPLILSSAADSGVQQQIYAQSLELARQLSRKQDFQLCERERSVKLTARGSATLEALTQPLSGIWHNRRRREELVQQALSAQHLYRRDRDYLVRDAKVLIVDEFTGRIMADRSWERGLHQLIEAKEGCMVTTQKDTLARTSYQQFFRRYLHLAGMTGTAQQVATELWSTYRLRVVRIPTHRPLLRVDQSSRIYPHQSAKWRAIVVRIGVLHRQGRPVLVGTRSVAASEKLSRLLTALGFEHRVLNARQDAEEAAIIARAGQFGQITVATNMAGRGTDIRLAPGIAALGGLHVIASERHEARRIDRQLFGRCGRHGDPGSFECILALDDEIVTRYCPAALRSLTTLFCKEEELLARWLGEWTFHLAQWAAERHHARLRRDLLKLDKQLGKLLTFAGRS
jgi:preprotein translocase subunit SecA